MTLYSASCLLSVTFFIVTIVWVNPITKMILNAG